MKKKQLPIYEASVEEEGAGMYIISLVDCPAVDVSWQLFKSTPQTFRIENPEQKLITGVVMLADTPIYRNDADGEYYIKFTKQSIEKMVQKFFKEGYQENVDTNHNFSLIDGIELQQAFIKDNEKGLSPVGFESVPEGSLFFTYKVTSDELWEEVKNGSWTGFSLAGSFVLNQAFKKETPKDAEYEEVLDMIEKVRKIMRK